MKQFIFTNEHRTIPVSATCMVEAVRQLKNIVDPLSSTILDIKSGTLTVLSLSNNIKTRQLFYVKSA